MPHWGGMAAIGGASCNSNLSWCNEPKRASSGNSTMCAALGFALLLGGGLVSQFATILVTWPALLHSTRRQLQCGRVSPGCQPCQPSGGITASARRCRSVRITAPAQEVEGALASCFACHRAVPSSKQAFRVPRCSANYHLLIPGCKQSHGMATCANLPSSTVVSGPAVPAAACPTSSASSSVSSRASTRRHAGAAWPQACEAMGPGRGSTSHRVVLRGGGGSGGCPWRGRQVWCCNCVLWFMPCTQVRCAPRQNGATLRLGALHVGPTKGKRPAALHRFNRVSRSAGSGRVGTEGCLAAHVAATCAGSGGGSEPAANDGLCFRSPNQFYQPA